MGTKQRVPKEITSARALAAHSEGALVERLMRLFFVPTNCRNFPTVFRGKYLITVINYVLPGRLEVAKAAR